MPSLHVSDGTALLPADISVISWRSGSFLVLPVHCCNLIFDLLTNLRVLVKDITNSGLLREAVGGHFGNGFFQFSAAGSGRGNGTLSIGDLHKRGVSL